jgi:glycerol-3-phosphate O-acyltransferase
LLERLESQGIRLFELERSDRLANVQTLADDVMRKVGELMPIPPVALACAALETFPSEYVPRDQLLERMADMRDMLAEHGAVVVRRDSEIAETFERAYRMLRMRRIVAPHEAGYLVLPKGRPLIAYYANSIRHLVDAYVGGLRDRDAPPVDRAFVGRWAEPRA